MTHQTLKQTKELLWNEIKEILGTEDNIEIMKEYKYKNEVKEQDITMLNIISNNPNAILDDMMVEKIFNSYMPTSYDDIIEWTKQEPLFIGSPIIPFILNDDASVVEIIRSNIVNYLKIFVYREIEGWLRNF